MGLQWMVHRCVHVICGVVKPKLVAPWTKWMKILNVVKKERNWKIE
jgi:hypothetical protein